MSRITIVMVLSAFSFPAVSSEWSPWFNTDHPSGSGDWECRECIKNRGYEICPGEDIAMVECKRVKTGQIFTEVTSNTMPNVFYARHNCTVDNGLSCANDQNIPPCEDYAIRFHCVTTISAPTTPEQATGSTINTTMLPVNPRKSFATRPSQSPAPGCDCLDCPSGWLSSGQHCYLAVECANVPCSNRDADRRCRAMGGYQARIMSLEDNELVASLVGPYVSRVLVAGSDQSDEGTWIFRDHRGQQPLFYTNWLKYQPDNAYGDENCIAIMISAFTKWDDIQCCEKFGKDTAFVCERPACCMTPGRP